MSLPFLPVYCILFLDFSSHPHHLTARENLCDLLHQKDFLHLWSFSYFHMTRCAYVGSCASNAVSIGCVTCYVIVHGTAMVAYAICHHRGKINLIFVLSLLVYVSCVCLHTVYSCTHLVWLLSNSLWLGISQSYISSIASQGLTVSANQNSSSEVHKRCLRRAMCPACTYKPTNTITIQ